MTFDMETKSPRILAFVQRATMALGASAWMEHPGCPCPTNEFCGVWLFSHGRDSGFLIVDNEGSLDISTWPNSWEFSASFNDMRDIGRIDDATDGYFLTSLARNNPSDAKWLRQMIRDMKNAEAS